jgi:hypothetical protein
MINLNPSHEYKEPEVTVFKASPDEALQARQDRLGGPAGLAELAPETACAQSRPMKNRHLSMEERIELEASMRAGDTQEAVAARLGRATGTISGELARNGGRTHYRAAAADQASAARRGAARRGRCAIDEHPPLRDEVHAQMRRGWSPEEIAGILKRNHPHLPLMHTSHESIYRYVYVVARGELKRELAACLRRHHRVSVSENESLITDSCHFNEIRIYERVPGQTGANTYRQRDELLIANQAKPFVLSVTPSQTAEQIQPLPSIR